ncbi:MAG TPA: PAS domain S-box protein [Gemmatimonadaceae bacterium]|nr:PAS domain S-box protein [Gemmatimonadaceae bacterium]
MITPRRLVVWFLAAAVTAALSIAATRLSLPVAVSPWNFSLGVGAGLVTLGGAALAPAVLLGQLAGAALLGWSTPVGSGLGPVLLSALSPLAVGAFVRRFLPPAPEDWTVRATGWLILTSVGAGVVVGGLALIVDGGGAFTSAQYFRAGVGSAVGVAVGLPAVSGVLGLVAHVRASMRRADLSDLLELLAHALLTLSVGAAGYILRGPSGERFWSLYFLPLLWTAFRFGMAEVASAQLLISLQAIVLAHLLDTPQSMLVNYHFFLFNFTATALLLAAALGARRQAERAKAAGDRRIRELVDTSFEGVWTVDRALRTTYANRRMAEIVGYDRAALRTKGVSDLVVGALPPALSATPPTSSGPRRHMLQELQLRSASGEVKTALVAMNAIVSEEGEDTGSLLMVSDLTERRRAEHAQRRSEALLAGALHITHDAVVLFRRPDGEMLDANPAWTEITGRTREELVGRSLFAVPEWDAETARTLFAHAAEGAPVRHLDGAIRHPSGAERYVEVRVEMVTVDAETFGVAFVRDVTESRLIDRQRQQSQKLEAIGLMAGAVAHDFNNILSVVASSAEMLRQSIPAGDRQHEDVESIHEAANRGAQLTRQLLAFSRPVPESPPRPVDAAAIISGMTGMLGRLLGAEIRIATALEEAPLTILAAPGQLEQVILNLAVNARDAMGRRGTLTLAASARSLTEPEFVPALGTTVDAGRWTAIAVGDSGAGIDPAIQGRIFEPFFTTKPEGRGTGLGLSTVYGIVRSVGGQVGVHSVVGEGTTFTIYWPGG